MDAPPETPRAWNDSWDRALRRYELRVADGFAKLEGLLAVVRVLHGAEQIRGLFAITSHDGLMISPYSCYPDWFDGRCVTATPLPDSVIRIRYARNCFDPPPEQHKLHANDAADMILRLCAEHL